MRAIGKWITAIIATAVVVVAMLWLSGTFRKDQIKPAVLTPASRPTSGPAVAVESVMMAHEAEVVGTIAAETRTTIAARVVANIRKVRASAGSAVKANDTLVELDDGDLKTRVEQAQAMLKSAEANRKLAQVIADTKKESFSKNAASQVEVDEAIAKLDVADAEVSRARQLVKEAEFAVGYAKITAPYDGIVIDRFSEEGDQASPGKALLTMYDPAKLRLEASVREAYIGYLKKGDPITLSIDAIRDPARRKRQGTVQEIVPAADPGSRSFLVKVALDKANADGLYPGMFGRMNVLLDPRPRLLIPAAAVDHVGQLALVNVQAGDQIERRSVRLGEELADQKKIEVLAGLEKGEMVVVPESK